MQHHLGSPAMLCACCLALSACGSNDSVDFESGATLDVKHYVNQQLEQLRTATEAMQRAAPAADDDGWNAKDDSAALDEMRAAWGKARDAYERVEGSIAVLFDGLDRSTDARYDAFVEEAPDANLFDDEGVVGMHAIERILWAQSHPARVVKFESTLPGYKAAAFPATRDEADAFKNELCARLARETRSMQDQFASVALQSGTAFGGMIGSMREQSEKTTKAASGEDESRYAQRTLDDMRANLAGARAVFEAFRPWIESSSGATASGDIDAEFIEVSDAYGAVDGPALPEVPAKFNPDKPSEAELQTPYGKLWKLLSQKTDLANKASLVSRMSAAADGMGLAGYGEP
jgi:iron uptake system component EfeO